MASSRRNFLVATIEIPAADSTAPQQRPVSDALVLGGGGARGVFQAGIICALARGEQTAASGFSPDVWQTFRL